MSFKQFLTEQEKGEEEDKVMGAIIEFFSTHDKPNDGDVHSLADSLGFKEGAKKDVHEFEAKIYSLVSGIFNAGSSKGKQVEPDEKELKMGMEVEKKHTNVPAIARKLALDNLAETPDYYSRLAKIKGEK